MEILVAYDGTEGAREAVRAALPIARSSEARLVLLHVLNPRADAAGVQAPSTAAAMREVSARAEAEVVIGLQERGEDPGDTIARVAGERKSDMVVIATRRAGGLAGFFLGSVTQDVIRQSPSPVLVVRV